MEHLTTLDAAFGALDDDRSALHIASLAVFAGPPLDEHDFVTMMRRKLHLTPRLRQVLAPVPLGLARPAWIDDTAFDLHRHLRHVGVAAPGTMADLERAMSEYISLPLDPDRPLWQLMLIDGLRDGRWAIATKVHHSMLDGIGGLALVSRLFDSAADAPLPAPDHWHPERHPSRGALVRSAMSVQVHNARTAVGGVLRTSVHPRQAVHDVRTAADGLLALRDGLRRTAPTSLAGPLGRERVFVTGRLEIARLDAVRSALGGTVNDVALALVTAAQRKLIAARRENPQPHQVHCLVPVSLRRANGADPAGNRVSGLIVDLPIEFGDPFARYQAVRARVVRAKHAHEADAGAGMQVALDALPAPLVSSGVRLAARAPQHFLTTVVTNVPGPHGQLFARGRPMLEHYPYVPIADRVRTGVALTSYDGSMFFGITADRDSMPDVEVLRSAVLAELDVLTALAHERGTA